MQGVRVVVVPADVSVPVESVVVVPSGRVWCELVGDVGTDTVFSVDGRLMVKVAVSGRREGRAVNVRASGLLERVVPGFAKVDRVLGDAVVVALDGGEDPTDVGLLPVSVQAELRFALRGVVLS